MGADCKSAGERLRWFKSSSAQIVCLIFSIATRKHILATCELLPSFFKSEEKCDSQNGL